MNQLRLVINRLSFSRHFLCGKSCHVLNKNQGCDLHSRHINTTAVISTNNISNNSNTVPVERNPLRFETNQDNSLKAIDTYNPSVVVLVVDLFDISFGIPQALCQAINQRNVPLLIAINHFSSLSAVHLKKELSNWTMNIVRKNRIKLAGKIILLDGKTGQNLDLLNEELEKVCKTGDTIGFLGFHSANVSKLVDNLYGDEKLETSRYSLVNEDGTFVRGYQYNLKNAQSTAKTNIIKFNAVTIPLFKPRQNLLNYLTPKQRELFVPSMIPGHIEGKFYQLNPNYTLILNHFLRIDYAGDKPIFINNFTNLKPLFFNTDHFNKNSKQSTETENFQGCNYGENELLKIRKPVNFPPLTKYKELDLPLSLKFKSKHNSISSKFDLDITLNGLGWLGINTRLLKHEGLRGKLTIYGLNGIIYPITKARLESWNVDKVKAARFNESGSDSNIKEVVYSE